MSLNAWQTIDNQYLRWGMMASVLIHSLIGWVLFYKPMDVKSVKAFKPMIVLNQPKLKQQQPVEYQQEQSMKVDHVLKKTFPGRMTTSQLMKSQSRFEPSLQGLKAADHFLPFDKRTQTDMRVPDMKRSTMLPTFAGDKISNPDYLDYSQSIRHRIKRQTLTVSKNRIVRNEGIVCINFVVRSDGRLKQYKVDEVCSSDDKALRGVVIKSLLDSNPFTPFPEHLSFPELTFKLKFTFRL